MSQPVAYLGPPGTFSEEAARRRHPDRRLVAFPTFARAVESVDSGLAACAIVPIENSIEGSVTDTLDILVHVTDLQICAEMLVRIEHCLLARAGTKPSEIQVVYSHPQALAQCRGFLESEFPRARLEPTYSTALAAAQAVSVDGAAAIATMRAADLYGAEVLAEGIQDVAANVTRFVEVGPDAPARSGDDKTSLAYTVADHPGSLAESLRVFADAGINLTKLESRPSRTTLGVYIFLVDCAGHRDDDDIAAVLEEVRKQTSFFKVLGSYPRSREV